MNDHNFTNDIGDAPDTFSKLVSACLGLVGYIISLITSHLPHYFLGKVFAFFVIPDWIIEDLHSILIAGICAWVGLIVKKHFDMRKKKK